MPNHTAKKNMNHNLPGSDAAQDSIDFFSSILNESSERAQVLVGAAKLESEVFEIYNICFPGANANRGGHMQRVGLLWRIGALEENVKKALGYISAIRNRFAHTHKACSLSDSESMILSKRLVLLLQATMNFESAKNSLFDDFNKKAKKAAGVSYQIEEPMKDFSLAVLMLDHYLKWAKAYAPHPHIPLKLGGDYSVDPADRAE